MSFFDTYSMEIIVGVIASLTATAIVLLLSRFCKWKPIPVPSWVVVIFIAFVLIWGAVSQLRYKKMIPIVDESFVTQRVVLDGKKFIRCNFDRCSLVFNGDANFGLENCNFTAPKLLFKCSAGITMMQISKMSNDPTFSSIIQNTMNEYKNKNMKQR